MKIKREKRTIRHEEESMIRKLRGTKKTTSKEYRGILVKLLDEIMSETKDEKHIADFARLRAQILIILREI